MLSCSDCLARHSEFLDGVMDSGTEALWQAHIAGCADCARYDRVLRRGLTLLSARPQLEPTPDFIVHLQHRLAVEDRNMVMRPVRSLAVASISVAAMLAFVAWLPVVLFSDAAQPAVAVSAPASPVATEIAWHGESAVESQPRAHIHFARRLAWSPSSNGHVIEAKYTPVVYESPTAPPSYTRTTYYGAE